MKSGIPVFNGTSYAPVRALAEAYGLEVGYDATIPMDQDKALYQKVKL